MLSLIVTWHPQRRGLTIGWMPSGIGGGTLLAGLLMPQTLRLFDAHHGWHEGIVVSTALGVDM